MGLTKPPRPSIRKLATSVYSTLGPEKSTTDLLLSALSDPNGVNKDHCLRLIREGAADLSARTAFGDAALHLTARAGHTCMVRHLVEAGADVNLRDNFSETPIIIAAKHGHAATVTALFEHGADPTLVNDTGKNFFDYAPDRLPPEQVARIARAFEQKKTLETIDYAAHHGVDEERQTPAVPVFKKKQFKPGGLP